MLKWTTRYAAAAAVFGMASAAVFSSGSTAEAGLFGGGLCHSGDCCPTGDCCETGEGCGPVVCRPACEQTYVYQRRISDLQKPCCGEDCCETECCPAGPGCAAPGCGNDCTSNLCSMTKKKGLFDSLCKNMKKMRKGLCSKNRMGCGSDCCEAGCTEGACCSAEDACKIAKLIYTAQTACYAKDRADAIDDLGDYDCRCNPEIMTALVYALNDTDERVRREAADEIGDLLEDGKCCCNPQVVSALTVALGDCDRGVRRQAEEALEACGYDVQDCDGNCCEGGCTNAGCTNGGCTTGVSSNYTPASTVTAPARQMAPMPQPIRQTAPAPKPVIPAPSVAPAPATAPAPPADPEAYFPSRIRKTSQTHSVGLGGLFSQAR